MRHEFGSAENATGYFDRWPRWLRRSRFFKQLSAVEFRLLVHFIGVLDWTSKVTPWLNVSELGEIVGAHRNTVTKAVRNLELSGIIVSMRKGQKRSARFRVQVVYSDPERQKTRSLLVSEEVSSCGPRRAYALPRARMSTPGAASKHPQEGMVPSRECISPEGDPGWLAEAREPMATDYEPGADSDSTEAVQ